MIILNSNNISLFCCISEQINAALVSLQSLTDPDVWTVFYSKYQYLFAFTHLTSSSQLCYGGVVPKSYYVRDSMTVKYDQCITISRGSSYQLDYEVLFPNCVLR